ncbi:cytochrome P450 4C1-like [Diprion similis]|uniref:cytochrome P450 4C1-like n=1 Tax=Diprion similis TaxID=362088 RepID=UPI001EF8682C|nr:cytochrome P450 4C1-like [Diprion similis]
MNFFLIVLLTIWFAIVFAKVAKWLSEYYKFVTTINKIPGPKAHPIVGNALTFIRVDRKDRLKLSRDLCGRYHVEGVFRIWFGTTANVYFISPETVSVILRSKTLITKSEIYSFIQPWLGTGLITSTGETWHQHRKLITPTFHFNILEEYSVVMFEKAEVLKKCIETELKRNPEEPIDMYVFVTKCALDIICEAAMGVNINVKKDENLAYSTAIERISSHAIERLFRPWLHNDWLYYQTQRGKEFQHLVETAHKFTNKVISEKKMAQKIPRQNNPDENYKFEKPKRQAFLDHLLDACEREKMPLTDDELRQEVDTFLFAGHDTSAATMGWALFCIGNNPEVQEKIHEEHFRIFGDSKEPATLQQINELRYLERVIKETLRLFPAVPSVSRKITEDTEIAGYKVLKGSLASILIHYVHRHPNHWPNPDKFDPDRFLPENSQGRHPYAYIPFSAGPRNCIGQKFSLLEQKIVLTAILREWKVKSALKYEEAKCYNDFILRPQDGIKIHFTRKQ